MRRDSANLALDDDGVAGRQASVDGHGDSIDVRGLIAGEKEDGVCDLRMREVSALCLA